METVCLNERAGQLQVLSEICERRDPVRVAMPSLGADKSFTVQTRFREMGDDYLHFEWPNRQKGLAEHVAGIKVEAFFRYDGQRLSFRAKSLGRVAALDQQNRTIPVWRISLPATIVQKQQRDAYRVPLSDLPPIPTQLVKVGENPFQFVAKLHNISAGGLACVGPSATKGLIEEGDLLQARFALPEIEADIEILLQIMHLRPLPEQESVFLGCSFCPGDDPRAQRDRLRHIEQFIAQRQRARLQRQRDLGRPGD
jgi:c-di-GMP-binding flagellar brake protein YcgR